MKLIDPKRLPKSLQRHAARIVDYSDERESDNGIWVYYANGWKSYTDPLGCLHQDHEDTITELAYHARNVMPCDCAECAERIAKEQA